VLAPPALALAQSRGLFKDVLMRNQSSMIKLNDGLFVFGSLRVT
jgi:hypothetical protein